MTAKLTYWAGRGRAEALRLTMAATGIEWEEKHMQSSEDLKTLRDAGVLAFNQLPLLEIDGLQLVQSGSTMRYLAQRGKIDGGSDPKQRVLVDIYMEGTRDFIAPFFAKRFIPEDTFKENTKKNMNKYLPLFERILGEASCAGHLVGNSLTLADVALFEVLLLVNEEHPGAMDEYKRVKAFFDSMNNVPALKAYLSSPRRHPPNTEEYVTVVKKTLGW